MMTDEECTGFDRNGIRFSLVIREYPGAVPEEKEELYRRMRAHGLECLKVGTEEYCPKPNFIPFFRDQKQITIGSKTDISLQIWDVPKGLNQKAAVFHYMAFPNNTWAIRSLKGMRHNRKEISVNNKIIDSSCGDVPIKNGDAIKLGVFSFRFKTDEREELFRYESPEILIVESEKLLKNIFMTFPENSIPDDVFDEISESGVICWEKVYLRHYRKILSFNWKSQELDLLRKNFGNKRNFNSMFVKMNEIRNKVKHPSRGSLDDDEKMALVDFYIVLKKS